MPAPKSNRITCPKCKWEHVPELGPLVDGTYKATCGHCKTLFRFKTSTTPKNDVTIIVNGTSYTVTSDEATNPMAAFLNETESPGTKHMCYAGSCGACIVSGTFIDPGTKQSKTVSFNSCLRPVYACDGWEITTSNGLGNRRDGFHAIQERIADYNGSQCGYCTPGWVMSMYSLLRKNPTMTAQEIEDSLSSNLCRCTGYRPILDAMKSFAADSQSAIDIEDLANNGTICERTGKPCQGTCKDKKGHPTPYAEIPSEPLYVVLKDANLYAPTSLQELYDTLNGLPGQTVNLVFGNVSTGIYSNSYDTYVNINNVAELYSYSFDGNSVQFGANNSLNNMVARLNEVSNTTGFGYCAQIAKHINQIACHSLNEVGGWAGNLMMKHDHPDFPSDMFTLLEAAGAKMIIGNSQDGSEASYSPQEFLSVPITGIEQQKVILRVTLPSTSANHVFWSYKLMPRHQFAHAYVNVAISMELDPDTYTVLAQPSIVYGCISDTFVHATQTEQYLNGKVLGTNEVLQGALNSLMEEVIPSEQPTLGSIQFRKNAAASLFYKFVLASCNDVADDRFKSGAYAIERPLSSGIQDFTTDESQYPVQEPMPKLASRIQASAEAEYIDMINQPNQLYAQFVLSTVGNARIESIDASAALAIPGVVAFLSAADIPGQNNFMPSGRQEEVFCSGDVLFAGQAIGIIVAESKGTAIGATFAVRVTYTDVQTPILTIRDAIAQGSFWPKASDDRIIGDAEGAIAASPVRVTGEIDMGTQYHMQMETQSAFCIPEDDGGMQVYAATQWCDMVQNGVAQVLDLNKSSVHVQVKRLGGGYGSKISRNGQIAAACALAAQFTGKPVKLSMILGNNMKMVGKRFPFHAQYEAGVTEDGVLNGVKITYYCDSGCTANEHTARIDPGGALAWGDNTYKCSNWHLIPLLAKTNNPSNTWCRAPGSTEGIFIMETVMEHIAKQMNMDPIVFKMQNLYQRDDTDIMGDPLPYCNITEMTSELMSWADVETRKADALAYNQANRWKKRALSVVPLKYGVDWNRISFNTLVSIYNGDGTVTITHAGVEIGQGITTKTIQVVAKMLGIDMSLIRALPTETHSNANSRTTGGSVTSELCCQALIECCNQLNERLAPLKEQMPGATWPQLIETAFATGVDLQARYWVYPLNERANQYQVYGATCAEVEVDILTGENQVRRVDMLYDCGTSINPEVDIGQIEGAFVMGLGYLFTEEMRYDANSGQVISDSTWDYHVPWPKDIPVDLRVQLLKNAPNPSGVLGNKASAEPPLNMACSALFAVKHCVEAARAEIQQDAHFAAGPPMTVEYTLDACLPNVANYTLN